MKLLADSGLSAVLQVPPTRSREHWCSKVSPSAWPISGADLAASGYGGGNIDREDHSRCPPVADNGG